MYSFVDITRNYIGGQCQHFCKYCFVNDIKDKFPNVKARYTGEIRLLEKELKKNEGSGKVIFVQDMSDLFAENIPKEFILAILKHLKEYPDNTYLFQSKNPKRMLEFDGLFPERSIFGTTIETNNYQLLKEYSNAPLVRTDISKFKRKFVTLEPIMQFDIKNFVWLLKSIKPDFVNIGADSKNHNLPEPSKEEITVLITELKKFTQVNLKDNLKRLNKK